MKSRNSENTDTEKRESRSSSIEKEITKKEISNGHLESQRAVVEEMKSEAVEKENAAIEKHFQDFQEARWNENPQQLELKRELISKSMDMGHESHMSAREIADKDDELKRYSDHTDARHSKQVIEKSLEQMDQYEELVREYPEKWEGTFSSKCSENTMIVACALHDVGMAGNVAESTNPLDDYEARVCENNDLEKGTVGEQIRREHSVESSMFVLSRRSEIEAMNSGLRENAKEGEEPDLVNVDEAAMLVALHSKSARLGENGTQVKNLSDHTQLLQYAGELKKEADKRGLTFSDDFLYTTDEQGNRISDEAALTRLSTEAAALRHGDSFRPSSDVQLTQSGRGIFIDATMAKERTESLDAEMRDVEVGFFTEDGVEDKEMRLSRNSGKEDTIGKAYAVGEKNIADIQCGTVDASGDLKTDVFLRDGNACPRASAFVINQRMEESASIDARKRGDMLYRIHSEKSITPENRETIRREIAQYQGIPSPEQRDTGPARYALVEDCSEEVPNTIRVEFVEQED